MGKVLVMHRSAEYSFEDAPDIITYPYLKDKIGGWVETAMKVLPNEVGGFMTNCIGDPGIMVMCDSDGHSKELDLTYFRPWDSAALVGTLYWVSYEDVVTDDGPDIIMKPLTAKHISSLTKYMKKLGWGELVSFNKVVADMDNIFSGGPLGKA